MQSLITSIGTFIFRLITRHPKKNKDSTRLVLPNLPENYIVNSSFRQPILLTRQW